MPAPPPEVPASKRDEWAALPRADREVLTPAALARWAAGLADDEYALGEIAGLERSRRRALDTLRDGVELTDQEFAFVRLLQKHEGRTVRFDEIVRHLWADARRAPARDVWDRHGPFARHVRHAQKLASTVRTKLEIDPLRPQHIVSVRSIGYRWYSAPPARDDGEDYGARYEDARAARYEIRGIRGELPPPRGAAGRFSLGPGHPDYDAIDADVTERRSKRPGTP